MLRLKEWPMWKGASEHCGLKLPKLDAKEMSEIAYSNIDFSELTAFDSTVQR